MKKLITLSFVFLSVIVLADQHNDKINPAVPSPDRHDAVGIILTKEQLKDEFMDSCKIDCPEIKHGATCSIQIMEQGKKQATKFEKKADNRCLAFKSLCETIKTKKLDPKKATEHTCSHP